MQVELIEKDGFKYISSRELAKLLQKHHKHVLERIRKNWLKPWVGEGVLFDRTGKKTNFALLSIDRAVSLLERYQQNDLVVELSHQLRKKLAEQTNLDRVWEKILPHIQPISTQILLRQQAVLVELGSNNACIKMKSQSLLNMVKDKVANVEAAFLQVFNRQIAVKLGLADPSQQPEGKVENGWSAAVVAGDRQISCSASEDLQSPEPTRENQIELRIELRPMDGYINATRLTSDYRQSTGDRKDVADWLRQKRTQEMMIHLASVTGIPVTELYQVNQGGLADRQGTWLHPRLSVRFAMWLSDDFGLLVENKVEEWVRGGMQPRPPQPKTQLQVLAETAQAMFEFEQKQLAINAKLESDLQSVKESVEAIRSEFKLDRSLVQDNLAQLPLASEAPPSVSVRNAISLLVRNYCFQSGRNHSEVWRELYTDMKYRYSYDAIARTENWNRSNEKKRSYIDQCEIDGMLAELHKVTTGKLFPGGSAQK